MNNSPTKIALLIESGGPGGAERVVVGLAQALKARGVGVLVITFREGWLTQQLNDCGIERLTLDAGGSFDFTLPIRLSLQLRARGATVLHSHLLDSNFYGCIAARLAGIRHVATEHGDVHHATKRSRVQLKVKVPYWLRSSITAVSNYSADAIAALGIPQEKIHVVPNPLFYPAEISAERREEIRASLDVDKEFGQHWVWAHVANLRPVKDQQTLIRAFAYASQTSSMQQSLWIIGDGEEREALEHLVKELGAEEQVRFLGFRNDVSDFLLAADGFVLSSLSEAFPMSLVEAAAAGLFIVSTDVGGVRDIIDEDCGVLVEAENGEKLGEAMCSALRDVFAAKDRAARAKEKIEREFSLDSVMNQYLDLYSGADDV